MALLFMDSFDHYATADITEKWTQIVAKEEWSDYEDLPVIGAYGRNSSQGIRMAVGGANRCGNPVSVTLAPTDTDLVIAGAAFKYNNFTNLSQEVNPKVNSDTASNGGSNWLFAIKDTNTYQVWFRLNTNGTISAFCGAGYPSTLLGTTTGSLQVNVWAYVEFKVLIHGSAGTVDVRINGVNSLSLTGKNTQAGASAIWNVARFGYIAVSTVSTITCDIDDVVVMDGSGSFNNAFIGDVTISVLNPNGAGNSTDWTPSAGSNYQCVDEDIVNDDTDYVSSSTLNAKDLYAMEDCAAGADIRAVQVVTAMRKGTEGPGKIKHVIRSNSTDYDSAEIGLGGTAYSFNRTIWETDPATAAAWTESGWNAAQVGVKKTG